MKVHVRKVVVVNLLVIAAVSFCIAWYVQHQHRQMVETLTVSVLEQQQDIISIASQNTVAFTEGEFGNCTYQARHDELLSQLRSLTADELEEALVLRELCGLHTFAARMFQIRALEDAVDQYAETITYLQTLSSESADTYAVAGWLSVIEKEREMLSMMRDQNDLQVDIIKALIGGDQVATKELVDEAQQLNDLVEVTAIQLSAEKEQLLSI